MQVIGCAQPRCWFLVEAMVLTGSAGIVVLFCRADPGAEPACRSRDGSGVGDSGGGDERGPCPLDLDLLAKAARLDPVEALGTREGAGHSFGSEN